MEGDGIGPEITAATMAVLRAADDIFKLGLSFTPVAIGLAALRAQGTTLPQAAVDAATAADGVILGPVSHNDYPPLAQGGLNPSGELRKRLDLFANVRPARSRGGFPPRCGSPVDLVIATTNMFGDLLSDLAAEISGSLGLAASLNAGEAHALAQAQHGSAPDIAGQDRANPASLIGSAAMLLNWLGERRNDERFTRAAAAIEDALDRAIASPQWRTRDP